MAYGESVTSPEWFNALVGVDHGTEGDRVQLGGETFVLRAGIWRSEGLIGSDQAQTATMFGYKWQQRPTYEGREVVDRATQWLQSRYGDVDEALWWDDYGAMPLMLDAGCGSAFSALALFASRLGRVRVLLGVDVSEAVDVAAQRFAEREIAAAFLQADLMSIPVPAGSVDVMFSEGVLHHTPSTYDALARLVPLLTTRRADYVLCLPAEGSYSGVHRRL